MRITMAVMNRKMPIMLLLSTLHLSGPSADHGAGSHRVRSGHGSAPNSTLFCRSRPRAHKVPTTELWKLHVRIGIRATLEPGPKIHPCAGRGQVGRVTRQLFTTHRPAAKS